VKESNLESVQVMVVSPIPSLRVGLKTILTSISDIKIIAEAASLDGSSALPQAVDVVLVAGLELPAQSWLHEILVNYPEQAFLFLVNSPYLSPLDGSLRRRPLGWLSLEAAPAEIAAAIRALQAGLAVFDPLFIGHSQASELNSPAFHELDSLSNTDYTHVEAIEPLTRREIDVLELLAQGMPNKEIARRLIISEHTVKYHISSIYSKFGVNNRTEAVRQGIRSGLIVI
jgi:NarL family two-component system response regulator YdfI